MLSEQSSDASGNAARALRAPNFFQLVHKDDAVPLHEQLYRRVRSLILSGELRHGARLASSRSLASALGMSRNSVLTALDRLVADGLLDARKGSGVYVTYSGTHGPAREGTAFPTGNMLTSPFALGVPPIDIFPARLWRRLQSRRWQDIPSSALHEGDAAGWLGLREAIAAHAAMTRGLTCSSSQIFVTSGIAAGVDLAVRSLGLTDQSVWMEEPGYSAATRSLQYGGIQLVPVPVDKFGLNVEVGRQLAPHAKAVFVTPACQFPTSVTMSLTRRRALLDWARNANA